MKKISLVLMASLLFSPVVSFGQASPQAPASWAAFQSQERAKKIAFYQQLAADNAAFLKANPDVQTYLNEKRAYNKARYLAWASTHPKKTNPLVTAP